jgi:hypothetical protein
MLHLHWSKPIIFPWFFVAPAAPTATFPGPEKAEKALASAAAEIQALCDSCRAALIVKTQRLSGDFAMKSWELPSGNLTIFNIAINIVSY